MSLIPINYLINDTRSIKDFKDKTFSGYKKKDVLTIFQKNILADDIEQSCHWGCELLISGYVSEIWNIIFSIYLKFVNIFNPKVIEILFIRYTTYLKISRNKNNLELRNIQIIRNHITEIICILCKSKKGKQIKLSKIDSSKFKMDFLSSMFKADRDYIKHISYKNDPPELSIIMNELYYNLIKKNFDNTIFWFTWCIEWEKINSKKKNKILISTRDIKGIPKNNCNDMIWIFWELILDYLKRINIEYYSKKINYLFLLFKLNYKILPKTKNIWFIIMSLMLLTKSFNLETPLINDYKYIIQSTGNINFLFLDFKKCEKTDDPLHNHKIKILNAKIIDNNQKKETKEESKKDSKKDKKNIKDNISTNKFNKLLELDEKFISNNSYNGIKKEELKNKVINDFKKN